MRREASSIQKNNCIGAELNRLVVLIPGWGSSVPYLKSSRLRKQFQKNGYDVAVVNGYPDLGMGCIKNNAEKIDEQLKSFSHREVVFVGHSMGGLIARELVKNYDYNPTAIITFGTPHLGAKLSSLLNDISDSMAQMNPGSDFLKELDANPPPMPLLNVTGSLDFLVKGQKLDWAENVEIPKATHLSLVASKRSFYEAWAWLTYDVFGEPGPYTDNEGNVYDIKLGDFLSSKLFFHELIGDKPIIWR